MDENLRKNKQQSVARTIEALEKNNIHAEFLSSGKDVVPKVDALLATGETVAVGGSMTLWETGIIEHLRNGNYRFLDRYAPDLTPEQIREIHLDAFRADTYLTSVNAITEHGELYCVDGRGNRVAAMIYGPKRVVLIVSWDKIVPDMTSAVIRVKQTAAPTNALRLDSDTYCNKTGRCITPTCNPSHLMALAPGSCTHTICSDYVVFSRQQEKDRMQVLIVGESLGY